MARPTLPSGVTADLQSEDYYETTLSQPLSSSDTDIYPDVMPAYEQCFGVLDPEGDSPEIVFWTSKGADYVRCPSVTDGQGRGVFQTTPQDWTSGTKFGIYSVSAYLEAIVTGVAMQDGFLQARHFSSALDPNQWTGTGESWTYGVSNGQREYTYVISGDKSTKYSPGMRLKMPRVTDVGYQAGSFVKASSHYADLASPAGISFTDDFTVEAWLYVASYGTNTILARNNGTTNGWKFLIDSTGRIVLGGVRAADDVITSDARVPRERWVHVAATMDSSGAAGTVYFDGVLVQSTYTNGGNSAIVQGTDNLRLGRDSVGNYFDGQISDVRLWSTVRSASNIRDNMHIRLTGSETNLVSYYKLSGNFNDSTANANNLSASGAVATSTNAPFASTEYALVTSVVYATGNTTITMYTGQNLAPAENLSNISYSSAKVPVGFPANPDRWTVFAIDTPARTTTSTSWASLVAKITIPVGSWRVMIQATAQLTSTTTTSFVGAVTLSSDATTQTHYQLGLQCYQREGTAASNHSGGKQMTEAHVMLTTATLFTLMGLVNNANVNLALNGTDEPSPNVQDTYLKAICGYL